MVNSFTIKFLFYFKIILRVSLKSKTYELSTGNYELIDVYFCNKKLKKFFLSLLCKMSKVFLNRSNKKLQIINL